MKTIELSSMMPVNALELDKFNKQTLIQVQHQQFTWETGWKNILQIALYQKGPDVSEVGSTWLDNLGDMDALRPFTPAELRILGDQTAFLPGAWHKPASDDTQTVSIPWSVDTRLIIYRRDLLAKAGIVEAKAFETPDALFDTLLRLQNTGMQYPLSMATGGLTFHNLASFVWGRGGHFRSPELKKITLVEPAARQGMFDFYRLHVFINPHKGQLNYQGSDQTYLQGQTAVLISGQWVVQTIKTQADLPQAVTENSSYAQLPGIPYLGGTHLVAWRHSLHDPEIIRLITHLTNATVYQTITRLANTFPARLEALNLPPFSNDSDYQLVAEIARRGRGFQTARRWGAIESRLNGFYEQLWADLLANPELELEAEIEKRTRELAFHLERTVLAS